MRLPFDTIMRLDKSDSVIPFGALSSLGHEIQSRQRHAEAIAQTVPHFALDRVNT